MTRRLLIALACLAPFALAPGAQAAPSPNAVISQVYGGGGNSGAPFTNDYVELFNRGAASVSLAGWSLQYTSATGTGNLGANAGQLTELSGSLAPGQHLLVQEASGGVFGSALPTPDVTDATPINMSATAGKVALVNTTTPLGCNGGSTPCGAAALATIVDLVGYGGANFFEGPGPAPGTSNTTAALRGAGGCTDADNNSTDFTAGSPAPHNTADAAAPCGGDQAPAVSSTSPADGAGGVALDANLSVTFSEPVNVADGWFSIDCSTSGTHGATAGGGPTTFTLDPGSDFVAGESCTLTVSAAGVTDQDADDPPDTMAADRTFTFSTVLPPTPIHDIQDSSHRSPFAGMRLSTSGVVTALASNGFWLQDPSPDGNDATSEGIFVFTSSAPSVAVGDALSVTGTVSEFRPGGASSTNLTTTELTGPSITVASSGNPLPAPVVIGRGGRVPPGTVIEDDGTGDVETSGVFDASEDGIDFYESLEGMRVQVNDAVASGPTADFGSNREIPVLADDGADAALRTARGGVVIRPDDFNPERVILNDLVAGGPDLPATDTGDTFPGATVGVMDYSFGNFKLQVSSLPARVPGGIAPEVTSDPGPGELAFATFNVENLDPNDPPAKFERLAGLIVHNLRSPDLISLEEVQDDNGPTNDATVDATDTYTALIDAIAAAGGPSYEFRQIDPVDDQDGGEPGGNIRVGFLFRSDRGLAFVDRPGGTSTAPVDVVAGSDGPELSFSPGRIDPTNTAFASSRKPLAGEFTYGGHKLFVVANHWNSKGGDQPLFGHFQPPQRSSEVQRGQQAQIVHDFVGHVLALDPNASVVVLGDLNDFSFSTAVQTLVGSPAILDDSITGLPESERYSYVFEGNSQALDHILFSDSAAARLVSFDPVHVNAEFADQASDHDPLVATVCGDTTPPSLTASASPQTLWPPNHKYVNVTVRVQASDSADPSPEVSLVSATSNEPDNAPGDADGNTTQDIVRVNDTTFKLRAERSERGSGRVYSLTYRATDNCGNAATGTATVTVPVR
jgi:predicted extracellular nuclease